MLKNADSITDSMEITPGVSSFQRFRKVFFGRKIVLFGLIVIFLLVMIAIFAPFIAPYDPNKINMTQSLLQPNQDHLLGTDSLGRDTLSRLIFGARVSLLVGISAIIIAGAIGILLGMIAGYFGGPVYAVIMRGMDTMMAIPMMVLVLVIASMLGGGLVNVVLALSIGAVPMYARMMCGQALSIRENDYILASRSMGSTNRRIMLRHLLPNSFPPLIVMMTMQMGTMILMESGLSFLGVGIQAPMASWGAMVTDGYRYLLTNPVLSFAPGLAIMIVVFAYNMAGDGLRDAIDPRLRGTL